MKKMILVTSPPASGKTYVSKQLAKTLKHVVYLDKDTLIPLSNRVFDVEGQERNRSSDFFEKNIRDYEYETILNVGLEALEYEDTVLINAPFTSEVHNEMFLALFKQELQAKGAQLYIVWVITDPKVCRQRMIHRNSDRDKWKIEHWDEYVSQVDFSIPLPLLRDMGHTLILFHNSSVAEYEFSMRDAIHRLGIPKDQLR